MKRAFLPAVFVLALAAAAYAQSAGDFTVDADGVITKYSGFDTDVVIPAAIGGKKITAVGREAFRRADLTSVTIPNGVTFIGESAFAQNKLTGVAIPGSVKTIEPYAFRDNPIAAVVIPEGVEEIGGGAFAGAKYTGVTLPSTIRKIDSQAFDTGNRPSLTLAANINIDLSGFGDVFYHYIANDRRAGTYGYVPRTQIKSADDYEYYETQYGAVLTRYRGNATRVRIPAEIGGIAVKALYTGSFRNKDPAAVQIPGSVTYIGAGAFAQNQLAGVTVPDGVTYIGDGAFAGNQLASAAIGSGVMYIGNGAFSDGGGAFMNNKLTSVAIPAAVTYIGDSAFAGNQLTGVIVK